MYLKELLLTAAILFPMQAAPATSAKIPAQFFQDPNAKSVLARLDRNAGEFKDGLHKALDSSVLNGTSLEDRLNDWANLLAGEVDGANDEYSSIAASGKHPDSNAVDRFARHWRNAMMSATAINRAMIRRGFAPTPESQWTGIRTALNRLAAALGRPPLPDMTTVIFRPPPPATLARRSVKEVMKDLTARSDRVEDDIEREWLPAMPSRQRHIVERWMDDLQSATNELMHEYKDRDAAEFRFKLEETLMLAAGLNRALLTNPASPVPIAEWEQLRERLNTLAMRFGYPVLPQMLHA